MDSAIRGGSVLTPEGIQEQDVFISDGLVVEPLDVRDGVDAAGLLVAPGLVDVQINGGWGHDFTDDPSTIWLVGEHLPAHGLTAFCPTVVSAPYDVALKAIDVLATGPPPDIRERPCLAFTAKALARI